jgi:hypothetical protein
MPCRLSRRYAGSLALALLASPALAQYGSTTPDVQPNNYPPALPARRGPGPSLVFERIGEVVLPGPLASRPAWAATGFVNVPVEAGVVQLVPELDAKPEMTGAAEAETTVEWIVSANGKRRYRTTQEGLVEAERRSHARRGWSRSWRIIAPNSILSPPILVGPRLCYAGLDDRVTCVRAKNGHRLWAVDLGDRLSRALAVWPAGEGANPDSELVLAVPDDGASVIALDAYDGRRVATYELPPHHHFASPALVVASGRIALARKGYDDREAALVLLKLVPPPPPAPPSAVPYNGASPLTPAPSGR